MKITDTSMTGVHIVTPEVHADERGEFWRSFCAETLLESGLDFSVLQSNVSVNPRRLTLRGFHYQKPPSAEKKILTVISGAAYVVVADLRPLSPTHLGYVDFNMTVGDRRSLVIAANCATAFLTLEPDTIVHYQMSDVFRPDCYEGFRFDDPAVGVAWPASPMVLSEKDAGFPSLQAAS